MAKRFLIVLAALAIGAGFCAAGDCAGRFRSFYTPTYTPYVAPIKTVTVVRDYVPILSYYQPFFAVPAVGGGHDPALAEVLETNRLLLQRLRQLETPPPGPLRQTPGAPGVPPMQPVPQNQEPETSGANSPLFNAPKTGSAVPTSIKPAEGQASSGDALAILSKNCASCHTGAASKGPRTKEGQILAYVLFTSTGVFNQGVHKGKAYHAAHTGTMPPGKPLADEDVAKLLTWLAAE